MNKPTGRMVLAALMAASVTTMSACQSEAGDSETESSPAAAPAPTAAPPAVAASSAPDTTGAAMWAHLQAADYAENWELWPEKGRLYPGQQPHGAQLTTLMNDVAYRAFMSGADVFPAGSIIVKQNFMPDGMLAAVTTMYKSGGYNPDFSDWFFTKHLASGELDVMPNGMQLEGRLPGCQGCHLAKQDNDYIFTGELGS